jgi:isopentenyl-diphosphate delta-isomerase
MNFDEMLDVVSHDDVVIAQEKRSIIYQNNLTCFRVVNGFICNDEKKLWIPRRHASKRLFPLHLDASVGGHVMSGETYEQAFVRESREELGLQLSPDHYAPISRLTPHEHGTSAFMWVYLIRANHVPDYNTSDFSEFYWLSIPEFFRKIEQGDCAKSDLLPILKHLEGKL